MIGVSISGVRATTRSVAAATGPDALRRVIGAIASEIHAGAIDGADEHTRKGALIRSIRNVPVVGGRAIFSDLSIAPHALFVHFGTKPHEITPKDKKALRWAANGAFHFAKKVMHPGYKGDAFLYKAADAAIRDFDSIVRRAMRPFR